MIDREKISQDIEFLKEKHGSFRAVAKVTGINKASLENYFEKITEPREKNIVKLAGAMHRDASYYYTAPSPRKTDSAPADVPDNLALYNLTKRVDAVELEAQTIRNSSVKELRDRIDRLENMIIQFGATGDRQALKALRDTGS